MTQSCKLVHTTLFIGLTCSAAVVGSTVVPPLGPEEIERRTQMRAWQSDVADSLIEDASADALFTAAMLLPQPVGWYIDPEADHTAALTDLAQRRLRLLDRAAKLEPQSADIASSAMHVCSQLDGCDIGAYAQRLHQAEPDGAAWLMPALHQASEQQDGETITQIVQQMGEAPVFDSYYGASIQRFQRAVTNARLPPMPSEPADDLDQRQLASGKAAPLMASTVAAVSFMVATMPRYSDVVQACRPERAEFAQRRSACRNIGLALTDASSMIDNQIGLALRRLAATDKPDELAAVQADIRTRDWLQHAYMQTDQTTNVLAFPRAVSKYGSEAKAIAALVAEAGLPTSPPLGWVSPRELRDAR